MNDVNDLNAALDPANFNVKTEQNMDDIPVHKEPLAGAVNSATRGANKKNCARGGYNRNQYI